MSTAELALSAVKSKSEELSIPFSNLASAFMLEEALSVIAGSFYSDHFILRNGTELSLAVYRRKLVHVLSFYYNGSFTVRDLAVVLTRTLIREKQSGINWEMSLHMIGKEEARVLMKGDLNGISVPFELSLTAVSMDFPAKQETVRLFFTPDAHITCLSYPKEQQLVDLFVEIIRKMELIHDLRPYDTVFAILRSESLDGRHIKEHLSSALFDQQLTLDKKRWNMLLNYRNDNYMKKKWKTYLRGEKKDTPSWEEVIDLLEAFFGPIWASMSEDTVFFGDWMPDLGRFL